MENKLEIVIRREDPFEYKGSGNWNEDVNTLGAKKVFKGAAAEMKTENGVISFIGGEKKLFNYDVIEHIEGHCYVRNLTIGPGQHIEKWREPTDFELESLINFLKKIYEMEGIDIVKEDIIYNWYISKKRDSKIKNILNEK